MRLSRFTPAATVLLTLPCLTSASLECDNIIVKSEQYNLQALEGDHYVSWVREEGTGNQLNTTFGINVCKPLDFDGATKANRCRKGTWVCGIEQDEDKEGHQLTHDPINIAGSYHLSSGRPLDFSWSRIQDSNSHADRKTKGLRLELRGGKHPWGAPKSQRSEQKAVIEFVCDPSRTGLEDFDESTHWPRLARREDDDDDDDDDDGGALDCDDSANNRSLSFCSYTSEGERLDVLRLKWKTKHACLGMSGDSGRDSGSSHWGFFTWLIVIIFLGVAGYLIFGSWLNYSRYGARGWDLIPHGETIRDIPYIVKDFGRNISNAVSSGGSRGGYSAV